MVWFLAGISEVLQLMKSIPIAFIGAGFGIYFSYMKLTSKITYSFSVSPRFYGDKLTDFVFQNRRDKTYVIQKVFCKYADGEISRLKDFHPPLILKPYEAVVVEFEDVSEWQSRDGITYKPNYMDSFEIFAFTHGKGVIKCKREYKSKHKEHTVKPFTSSFDDLILQGDMFFVLAGWQGKKSVKIVFYRSGFLDGSENFGGYNYIDIKDSPCLTVEDITRVVFRKGFDKQWDFFRIYSVENYKLNVVFTHRSKDQNEG